MFAFFSWMHQTKIENKIGNNSIVSDVELQKKVDRHENKIPEAWKESTKANIIHVIIGS